MAPDTEIELPNVQELHLAHVVPEGLKCSFCSCLLAEPCQLSCGHRCCLNCVPFGLSEGKAVICPIDQESAESYFLDKGALREILLLQCYCIRREKGCTWEGQIGEIGIHRAECEFELQLCDSYGHGYCERLMSKDSVARFAVCQSQTQECAYCHDTVTLVSLSDHEFSCQKRTVTCNFCHIPDIPQYDMEIHFENDCIVSSRPCRFVEMGCNFFGTRLDLEEHLRFDCSSHLGLLGDELQKRKQTCEDIMSLFSTTISRAGILLEGLSSAQRSWNGDNLGQSSLKLQDDQDAEDSLPAELVGVDGTNIKAKAKWPAQKNSDLRCHPEKTTSNIERKLRSMQDHVNSIFARLSALGCNGGYFIWKVDRFSEKFTQNLKTPAKDLFSPPFFTRQYGYKLCARLVLNGNSTGSKRDDKIALYCHLMRGEHDALLTFPFESDIKLTLISQDPAIPNIVRVIAAAEHLDAFQRPKHCIGPRAGFAQICNQNLICRMVKEDVLFVKFSFVH